MFFKYKISKHKHRPFESISRDLAILITLSSQSITYNNRLEQELPITDYTDIPHNEQTHNH